jgi:hypothetical protein
MLDRYNQNRFIDYAVECAPPNMVQKFHPELHQILLSLSHISVFYNSIDNMDFLHGTHARYGMFILVAAHINKNFKVAILHTIDKSKVLLVIYEVLYGFPIK